MSALAFLPDEVDGAPQFFVEPVDSDPASEFDRQRSFLRELRQSAPAIMAMAVPNGSHDTDWQRIRKWREGAVAGAFDLWCGWNHGSFWFEFKSGKGRLKPAQVDFGNRLTGLGFRCACVRRPETAIRLLREAGAPFLWEERR